MSTPDLFGHTPQPLIGMTVRLDRSVDRNKPCCNNLAAIERGKGPHAGELFCTGCGVHRGWLPKVALDFLTQTAARFGAPSEPITLRDSTIGDQIIMTKQYDNTNSGALFKNDDKQSDKHADYRGTLDVGGVEYWISAWIKTSKAGKKFMSLSIKPKDPDKVDKAAGRRVELDDEIPF